MLLTFSNKKQVVLELAICNGNILFLLLLNHWWADIKSPKKNVLGAYRKEHSMNFVLDVE